MQVAASIEWNHDGALKLVRLITDQEGIDVNHKDDDGQTALMVSLQAGFFEASDVLIALGCDIKIMDAENRTALHYACEKQPSESVDKTILKLVEAGLQLSQKDSKSKSAFEFALYSKDLAPQAYESAPDNIQYVKGRRKDRKVLDDNLWAPFSEIGNDSESNSESESDFGTVRFEHNRKEQFDESTQNFWHLWNKRIVAFLGA